MPEKQYTVEEFKEYLEYMTKYWEGNAQESIAAAYRLVLLDLDVDFPAWETSRTKEAAGQEDEMGRDDSPDCGTPCHRCQFRRWCVDYHMRDEGGA